MSFVAQLTLQYESDGWIMVATESGRSGLVPEQYLRITAAGKTPFGGGGDPFAVAGAAADDPFSGGVDPFAGEPCDTRSDAPSC